MVELGPERSLEEIRAEIIEKAISKKENIHAVAKIIDFEVYISINESIDLR